MVNIFDEMKKVAVRMHFREQESRKPIPIPRSPTQQTSLPKWGPDGRVRRGMARRLAHHLGGWMRSIPDLPRNLGNS